MVRFRLEFGHDLGAFFLELQVSSGSHLEGLLDGLLGAEILGASLGFLGSLAEGSDALRRQTRIVGFHASLAQFRNQCLHDFSVLGAFEGIFQESFRNALGGIEATASPRDHLVGVVLRVVFLEEFLVRNHIECVGEYRQCKIVQDGNAFFLFGFFRFIVVIGVPNSSELNEG